MARLGRASCRSGRGLLEDAPRELLLNFLVVILALEFINEIDLITQTLALKADAPSISPSQDWRPVRSMVSQAKAGISIATHQHRQKKLYSSPVALSSVHSPMSALSYSSSSGASELSFYSSDISDLSVQHNRRSAADVPANVDAAPPDAASNTSAAPSGLVQPPVSPHNGCCASNMVQRRGSQDCHCVYPVRVELFLRNVSLNSNWSNEFLEELAAQLNLRVSQFEIVNFYVVGASGLNITMNIAPHTGNSFPADQVTAMNYSLSLHKVQINPVLVGDYSLLNLTWFRSLAPAPADGPIGSPPVARNAAASSDTRKRTYVRAGSSILVGVCLFLLMFFYWYKKYYDIFPCQGGSKNTPRIESFLQKQATSHPKRYSYPEVRRMTNSFAHKLGQGGFGAVYRGKLPDGREIAVKMLKDTKGDGEEFMNEVASISRCSHINVVTLLGFCLQGSRKALIYEYMINGSLERYTFGNNSIQDPNALSWERLFDIVLGIARGLEYLHRGCNTPIIHFDIKPQNILLDGSFCPKISDFGLAKLCHQKESRISIGGARGTVGYIAPEVFSRQYGAVSSKSDVYGYGMVVLEMVGARNQINVSTESSTKYFPQWIYDNFDEFCGTTHDIVSSETTELLRKMTIVGLWCIQLTPTYRPSMSKVLDMLESDGKDLQLPPKAS